eukprot:TRINITY_DN35_c0_g1_i5.p3 TRINITY_DN35_c0_g1~~TRINITY_DN35_c0_g1_i5.p3  ORF type:complete len:72 (-),score=39.64 TRINITY_DN35_c0_g1_i5:2-217(-)
MLQMVPNLIYDFGFLIEGYTDDQLPEQVLISARVNKCPFEMAGIWEKPKDKKKKKYRLRGRSSETAKAHRG